MSAQALSAEQARVSGAGPFPDYPFVPRSFVHPNGLTQSYLDEGPRDGEVVVMLHGNPSWSYYWRKLVLGLRDRYRCIVPDHIGMGLSDKPDDAAQGRASVAGGRMPRATPALAKRERWLALNKMDLLPEEERERKTKRLLNKLKWKGPVYRISAINREGCRELVMDLMRRLEQLRKKTEKTTHVRKRQQ